MRRMKREITYRVFRTEGGWVISVNGKDCGFQGNRSDAILAAIRWANRNRRQGYSVQVISSERDGSIRAEWGDEDQFPPLRLLAELMRRPSAHFVDEWSEWDLGDPRHRAPSAGQVVRLH
jgi:hypothetical protein